MLKAAPDITIIGEASNGIEALKMVNDLCPDVLLLDMEMPGLHGLQVAQELESSGSEVVILALSAYKDKHYIMGVLATGAAGYLSKDELPETIIAAIRGVARGESGWISKNLAANLDLWLKQDGKQGAQIF